MNSTHNIETLYRLTPLQEGILYHTLEHDDPGLYVGQYICEMHGEVDAQRLQQAWQTLVARHASLRTLFAWRGQENPVQIVRAQVDVPWSYEDWRETATAEQTERWQAYSDEQRGRGFVLDQAPLIRLALVRMADEHFRFAFCYHHIMLDGWSLRLLLDEATRTYHANALASTQVDHAANPLPYIDFVEWLHTRDWSGADAYWAQLLGHRSAPTRIPLLANSAPIAAGARHRSIEVTLDLSLATALAAFARGQRITLNTLFIGAWAILLSRYTDDDEVLFGTTWAGRPEHLAGCQRTVGLFINTLPTCVNVSGQSVSDWLNGVQTMLVAMREHEQTPLLRTRRASQIPADQPLFESLVVMQSVPATSSTADDWQVANESYFEYSNYPVALLVRPGSPFRVVMVHDQQRFASDAIERLLKQYLTVLENMISEPQRPIGEIEVLSAAEQTWLLARAQGNTVAPDSAATMDELIGTAARVQPQRAALIQDSETVTYAAFDDRATQVAAVLRQQMAPGFFAAVFLERTPLAMTAMLAILKAGGIYVPLDPAYPPQRTRQVLGDLSNGIVITRRALADDLPDTTLPVVFIDDMPAQQKPVPPAIESDDLAYVMYTSGTSGQPKGTQVNHGNLLASTAARNYFYGEPPARFLLLSSLATDSSIAGIFWTLSSGGTLVMPKEGQEQAVTELLAMIQRERITHILCLPSLYAILLEYADAGQMASLRCVIVAGEACPPELVQAHFAATSIDLYNEYGPSEATVWATVAKLDISMTEIPIGQPIANTQTYVLDASQRLAPTGLPGELYIGGAGVAAGYLGREALTAQHFIPNPFGDGKLYRTGDRVRMGSDGQLYFLGRVDHQLKVRGFRVEPAEIEQAMASIAGISEAAVVAGASGRLTAYFTGAGVPPEVNTLRTALSARLPDFMVPQSFTQLDALPRSPGGKIDRAALRTVDPGPVQNIAYVAPRNDTERLLATIWAEVLEISEVSINANFFELGGDSLLSIRILARAHKRGLEISPADFFAQPTIAGQAAIVSNPAPEIAASKPFSLANLDAAGLAAVARQLGDADNKS